MFEAQVLTHTQAIADLQDGIRALPVVFTRYARREVAPFVRNEVTRRLRVEPGPVVYPIRWTSEKQRRAFFATDGFGHGIPYRRSHELVHDWHVIGDYADGLVGFTVTNDNPSSIYVYGDDEGNHRQAFHATTGWPDAREELRIIRENAEAFVTAGINTITEQVLTGRIPL
ncbi:MAG TPA: hypothetical protein PKD09_17945 [Aggregatilinea sp.]|uniref:hypothetical protein n=1 Tax=Aggregatilinea sp. TaxID=2806333 RepID=UPI002BE5221B|nr:hypothetical protein [Aggregatilinea sp.]HML23544.1 hypothetical protein [Aggregatilinea sp.]